MSVRVLYWCFPAVFGAFASAAVATPVQGTLYFSEDFNANGLYTLDILDGSALNVGPSGVVGQTVGLAPTGDETELWGSQWFGLNLVQEDGSGFSLISTGISGGIAEGMAYDPNTDTLYGSFNTEFFTIDTATGQVDTALTDGDIDYEGLAFGNDGVFGLPGFTDSDTNLWFYNPAINLWSIIGDTGIDWSNAGLAYDPLDDVLYAKNGNDSLLYRIDPATGLTSAIGDTGISAGGGLAFVPIPEPTVLAMLLLGATTLRRRRLR